MYVVMIQFPVTVSYNNEEFCVQTKRFFEFKQNGHRDLIFLN